jgi:hypothetical protein
MNQDLSQKNREEEGARSLIYDLFLSHWKELLHFLFFVLLFC